MDEETKGDNGTWNPILSRDSLMQFWAVFFFAFFLILTLLLYGGCSKPSGGLRLADESSTIIPTLAKGETDV